MRPQTAGFSGFSWIFRIFRIFQICFTVLGPGRCPKGFPEPVRFISTHREPIPTHGDPFQPPEHLPFSKFSRTRLPRPMFFLFVWKNDFLMKELTPLDPSKKIRTGIPHQTMCLPAPHLRSDLQWRQQRSEFKSFPLRGCMPAVSFFCLFFYKTHTHTHTSGI